MADTQQPTPSLLRGLINDSHHDLIGQRLRAVVFAVAQVAAFAYVLGLTFGQLLHHLNDTLTHLISCLAPLPVETLPQTRPHTPDSTLPIMQQSKPEARPQVEPSARHCAGLLSKPECSTQSRASPKKPYRWQG
jgi:hypothetical protein